MTEAVTDIIVARARSVDRLTTMVTWSVLLHIAVLVLIVAMPDPAPEPRRLVMTISLGGAPGPRVPGLTQAGGREVQPTPPPPPKEPVRRVETPPAQKAPAMTLPDPKARPQSKPKDASTSAPATEAPREGSTRTETPARGRGFGLSSAGGGDGGLALDVKDFCCPEYLNEMTARITRNWQPQQGLVGSTVMKFTITRDGSIPDVVVERPSGFVVLDNASQRAMLLTQAQRLPPLPTAFPNSTLTVYLRFDYAR